MSIDSKLFFNKVRSQFGSLKQSQVVGFERILDEWDRRQLTDLRWFAYILATAWHETAFAMQPVIETRQPSEPENPSVDKAIARLERSWAAGKMPWVKSAYWRKNARGLSYLGRGLPQLTHEANYAIMAPIVGADLVGNPDLALEPKYAIPIMFEGMLRGSFTGKKLADYFSAAKNDPANARRIINGTDKADLIAGYHTKFLAALKA